MTNGDERAVLPELLLAGLEAVLFAADEPVPIRRMVRALERYKLDLIEAGLKELRRRYNGASRGVELVELGGGWQLFTKRPFVRAIERALGPQSRTRTRLSNAALETLAIVAYRQPVTRGEIEAVRGVDCSGTLTSLQEHKLIEVTGRAESPGRPHLYGTTEDFLNYFGLRHLGELPPPEQELLDLETARGGVRVAVDGPAGSGKSTVARLAAARLGLVYVDTGAIYRALTWLAQGEGVDFDDPAALVETAREAELVLEAEGGATRLRLNGKRVGAEIRTPEVTAAIRHLADLPPIRDRVNALVRRAAEELPGGVIVEGRDTGSLLFPDTPYKLYLTASVQERARRRLEQEKARGRGGSLPELEERILERDKADTTRTYGALQKMPEAQVIDTDGLTIQEVVEAVVEAVRHRRAVIEGEPEPESTDEEDARGGVESDDEAAEAEGSASQTPQGEES